MTAAASVNVSEVVPAFEGWLPLHAAAALSLPVETLHVVIAANRAALWTPDAHGMLPLVLALMNDATPDVVACLWRAAEHASQTALSSRPELVWHLATDERYAQALEVLCACSDALKTEVHAIKHSAHLFEELARGASDPASISEALDTGAAKVAYRAPVLWQATVGAAVRCKRVPTPEEVSRRRLPDLSLRQGEVSRVTSIGPSCHCRLTPGKRSELNFYFEPSNLMHIFHELLPLHAAAALALPSPIVHQILQAHPAAASTPDSTGMLPLALALANHASDQVVLALALAFPAAAGVCACVLTAKAKQRALDLLKECTHAVVCRCCRGESTHLCPYTRTYTHTHMHTHTCTHTHAHARTQEQTDEWRFTSSQPHPRTRPSATARGMGA